MFRHEGTPSFVDVGGVRRGLEARGKGSLLDAYSFTQNGTNVKGAIHLRRHIMQCKYLYIKEYSGYDYYVIQRDLLYGDGQALSLTLTLTQS